MTASNRIADDISAEIRCGREYWKRQCHRTRQDISSISRQEVMAACNALKSNPGEII